MTTHHPSLFAHDIECTPLAALETSLSHIAASPRDSGAVELIVCRPRPGERTVLESGRLDEAHGLVGDGWRVRSDWQSRGGPVLEKQLTLMNARVIAAIARDRRRWVLAGDQLFVDLDLSADLLPPGSRLSLGSAEIEITAAAHIGCRKFAAHFGSDAVQFVNSPRGRQLRLRGVCARVIRAGVVAAGDVVRRSSSADDADYAESQF